ncbi:GGDEF domain-containing protein [Neorhizobium galegae]|uniref:GGDEF domain-containing protein n=1 Tax=Neorhizobium galegae TaxID=399 RepID=UPI0021067416|nr:GGDEF domain-containing protein [Neorhizobium galegae]MCQ1835606.1 GGDEF domain-containing protein [Neorhizobium galegae]
MLDLRTIYIVSAMTCSVLGIVQMIAYSSGRFERWLFWWSASGIVIGAGLFSVGLRNVLPDVVSILIGNNLILVGYLLLIVSVRLFGGRPVRWGLSWLILAVLSTPLILLWRDDASTAPRIAIFSLVCALGDLLVMLEGIRLARQERLRSAWLVAAIYMPTAAIFAARALLAVTGWIGEGGLFSPGNGADAWLGLWAAPFLALRSIVINLMAAERAGNKLSYLADRDALTGVLNRGGLMRCYAGLEAGPVALMLIDVDHFKQLNDTHGHAVGDEVLRRFASSASLHLRNGDLFARHGGDEFVIALKGSPVEKAVETAQKIRAAFADSLREMEDLTVLPTLSIGVAAEICGPGELESLLQRADQALYARKRNGRDGIDTFEEDRQAA